MGSALGVRRATCRTRVQRLTRALAQQIENWRMLAVETAMTLRGLDLVAATTVVAELGEMRVLPIRAISWVTWGWCPASTPTGKTRRLYEIAKTGNGHARRVLVEAAWNYRFPTRISRILQVRQQDQPVAGRAIAWRAQRRLSARGVQPNKVCVTIARELAGFVWDLGRARFPRRRQPLPRSNIELIVFTPHRKHVECTQEGNPRRGYVGIHPDG